MCAKEAKRFSIKGVLEHVQWTKVCDGYDRHIKEENKINLGYSKDLAVCHSKCMNHEKCEISVFWEKNGHCLG